MMRQQMTTRTDLRNWVDSHVGDGVTQPAVDSITDAIQADDHPA